MSWATPAFTLPSTGTLVGELAGAAAVIAVLVLLMRRREDALPLLSVLALPFRVPVSADGRTVNLLIPLYLVVVAGVLAHLLPRLLASRSGSRSASGSGPVSASGPVTASGPVSGPGTASGPGAVGQPRERWISALQWLLLGMVVLYALQGVYSADRAKAAENIAFFYVPFGLLFLLLRDVAWNRVLLARCLGLLVVLAVVLAGVGFLEYYRKELFLNPKLVAANQYDNYFRVNSVFFDPSIYGRFLMLVMIAVTTVVLWGGRREAKAGAIVLAWLLAGLVTSFSQSSIAALLLGLAVLSGWRWGFRRTIYWSLAIVALGGAILLLAPSSLHFGLRGKQGSAGNATSGRASLITGGLKLFGKRPLQGYGSGSFEREYKRNVSATQATQQNATSASHTIPVTVAAEQGLLGLAVYLALLVVAFVVLFSGAGRSPPRIALAAGFAALVLHTWTYADFLEDPFTWALLGIGVALARAGRAAQASSV